MLSSDILERIKEFVFDRDDFYIFSHYDTDGICSLFIFKSILDNLGKNYKFEIIKCLDEKILERLDENIIFLDLGSGYIDNIKKYLDESNFMIIDHHEIKGKTRYHLNPHLFNMDGSKEISGSGTVNLFANYLGLDFSDIALIGATGDLQFPFIGKNRELLKKSNIIEKKDLILFGRYTRKLPYFLSLSYNPYIPEITGNLKKSYSFLYDLGFVDFDNIKYCDLDKDEKRILIDGLIKHFYKHKILDKTNLIDYVYDNHFYDFVDLREISSAINSCGRHGYFLEALYFLETGKSNKLKEAIKNHKKILKKSLEFAKENLKIKDKICILNGIDVIPDCVIGIICSSLLKTHKKLIVGFSKMDEDRIKVSVRNPFDHIDIGKFLSENYDTGGGHKKAGGCIIKEEEIYNFIRKIEKII